MKVLIQGKREFNKFMEYNNIIDDNVTTKDMMIISINNHIEDINSYFKRQHSNVMIMHFGDYSIDEFNKNDFSGPTGIFNEYKAKKLYEFIKRNKEKKLAVLHCGAGISRSGAIGTFIFDLYGEGTFEEFKRKNPRVQPNQHILRLLNEQKRNDKSIT